MSQGFLIDVGDWRVDSRADEITRDGVAVRLAPQKMSLLLALAERPGEVVLCSELLDRIWRGKVVTSSSVYEAVSQLRRLLGTHAAGPYVETVARKGYRLVAPVRQVAAQEIVAIAQTHEAFAVARWNRCGALPVLEVAPLRYLTDAIAHRHFADEVFDGLTTALANSSGLVLRCSIAPRRHQDSVRHAGAPTGTGYLLEGTVRTSGAHTRISVRLADLNTKAYVWSDRFEAAPEQEFEPQDRMTAAILMAMVPALRAAGDPRIHAQGAIDDHDALYLRAASFFHAWTRDGNDQAIGLLRRFRTADPQSVRFLLLEEACWRARGSQGWSEPEQAIDESQRCVQLAVRLDPSNSDALALLARRLPSFSQELAEATSIADQAVSLDPGSSFAWRCKGYVHVCSAEADLAVGAFRESMRLSPLDSRAYDTLNGLALAQLQLGNDDEAIAAARAAVRLNDDYAAGWRALTAALSLSRRQMDAKRALRQALRLDPRVSLATISRRVGFNRTARTRYFDGLQHAGVRSS